MSVAEISRSNQWLCILSLCLVFLTLVGRFSGTLELHTLSPWAELVVANQPLLGKSSGISWPRRPADRDHAVWRNTRSSLHCAELSSLPLIFYQKLLNVKWHYRWTLISRVRVSDKDFIEKRSCQLSAGCPNYVFYPGISQAVGRIPLLGLDGWLSGRGVL